MRTLRFVFLLLVATSFMFSSAYAAHLKFVNELENYGECTGHGKIVYKDIESIYDVVRFSDGIYAYVLYEDYSIYDKKTIYEHVDGNFNKIGSIYDDYCESTVNFNTAIGLIGQVATDGNEHSAASLLDKLKYVGLAAELVDGLLEYDDTTEQALYLLGFMLRNSKYVFGAGLVSEENIIMAYRALDNRLNYNAQHDGVCYKFDVKVKKDGWFGYRSVNDAEVKLHPITKYYYVTKKYEISNYSPEYATQYAPAFGYMFGHTTSGLYLAEIEVNSKTYLKPIFVEMGSKQTATVYLSD